MRSYFFIIVLFCTFSFPMQQTDQPEQTEDKAAINFEQMYKDYCWYSQIEDLDPWYEKLVQQCNGTPKESFDKIRLHLAVLSKKYGSREKFEGTIKKRKIPHETQENMAIILRALRNLES